MKAKDYLKTLKILIERSLIENYKEVDVDKTAILFSAGIDSTLLAKVSQDLGFKPKLVSLTTSKSKDIQYINRVAVFSNLPIIIYTPKDEEISNAVNAVRNRLNILEIEESLMHVSLGVCVYLLSEFTQSIDLNYLITGQGADEIFAGYYKYKFIKKEKLSGFLEKEIERVLTIDSKRDRGVASIFNQILYTPYLNKDIINFAKILPIEYKINNNEDKIILRRLAFEYNIADFVVKRAKKAMQYSTGIQKLVLKCLPQSKEK